MRYFIERSFVKLVLLPLTFAFSFSQLKEKRKKAKRETGKEEIEEDDPVKYKHACYVMTCKLFADLERLKKEGELKQAEAK